jgi:hypothetical protein
MRHYHLLIAIIVTLILFALCEPAPGQGVKPSAECEAALKERVELKWPMVLHEHEVKEAGKMPSCAFEKRRVEILEKGLASAEKILRLCPHIATRTEDLVETKFLKVAKEEVQRACK